MAIERTHTLRRLIFTTVSILVASCLAGRSSTAIAADRLRVVATLPNLASIASVVGGDRVEVSAIASGLQDAHFVDPKPSFMVKLRSADLLLVNGLDLEIGWVPPLTQGARNSKILPGGPGYVDCSARIDVMEIPSGPVSRAQGDVHPFGNPHYLADPINAEVVAAELAEAFSRAAPADAAGFEARKADFVHRLHESIFGKDLVDLAGGAKLSRLSRSGELDAFLNDSVVDGKPLAARLGGWLGAMRAVAGAKVITYHKDYSYFVRRFKLDVVEFVEPKPGIPPSLKHIEDLVARIGAGDVKLLITRPYVEHRSTDQLTSKTGIQVITLPLEVGGAPEATDYFKLFDLITSRIVMALGKPAGG